MMSLESGGAEKSLVNLLNEMPPDRYEIDLFLFRKSGPFLNQVPSYVNICDIPVDIQKLYGDLREAKELLPTKVIGTITARLMEDSPGARAAYRWKNFYSHKIKAFPKKYDIAFAYITGETMFYTVEKINADRKVCFVHNDYKTANHPKKYDYEYFKKLDGIASISDTCCDILKQEFPEFQDKVWCIQNITSSSVVKKQAELFMPKEYDGNNNTILSIGRLMEQKGFHMAIQAAFILKNRGIKFHWFIIGEGALRKQLEKMIQEKNVSDCFTLLGIRENPYPYIKQSKLFIQTSLYEGKSVVLDETKILQKPIVVTNYPTVGDQIVDGNEGIIVDMNAISIADGVQKMFNDSVLYKHIVEYLSSHEYGNEEEIDNYFRYLEGI